MESSLQRYLVSLCTSQANLKEAVLGKAKWGNKIIVSLSVLRPRTAVFMILCFQIKRFQCDIVVGDGANGRRCTKTFTRKWDMEKHRMLHDPTK